MNSSNEFLNEQLYTVGKVTVDKSLHTQSADEAFFRFFGNDVIYSIKRTVDEKDFLRLEQTVNDVKQGETLKTVIRMKGVNNELRWMLATVRLAVNSESEPLYNISLSDILSLEALAYNREYRISEYRHMLSMINDLAFEYSFETKLIRIYMFDCFREIVLVNKDLGQWQKESIELGYVPPRYADVFRKLCSDIENGVYRFDYEFESSILTYGKTRELSLFRGITRYDSPEKRKVTGIISSISSRNKTKDLNLSIEANRDSLSELLNKRAITELAQNILSAEPNYNVNLILLDIDNFSQINNSYGHLFGDEVIFTVASIIKTEIGTRGFAGRISGEGFLIVIEDTCDETDLRGILRAIRSKTEWAFAGKFNENFRITCSLGASTYPIDSDNYDELFMQADKALFIAKEKGKNRYVIYDINKHGQVEKDMQNKIAFLSNKKDSSEKLSFIGSLADTLVAGKTPDISVLLEQIRALFSIDDICIFSGNDMKMILSCGNTDVLDAGYIFANNYTERFSGDNLFVIDNINELEGRDDNAFEILSSQNIGGAVQYLITEDNIIKGLISFCYVKRFKKWADTDTDYLTILARIISAVLKKQAFI
ncbi:MAG: GGDEF domain-containing protein [Ruminococcus sp.]|nr:GGDEF domain-containing protein [Ruminococcus sp.]